MHNPYRGGTWDVWYSGKRDLWVEYKFIVLPVRDATVINLGLSELQLKWGRDRFEEGRNLAVIVGCKDGGIPFTNLGWERPITSGEFRSLIAARHQIANFITHSTGI